jgi:precorrin-2 methylase
MTMTVEQLKEMANAMMKNAKSAEETTKIVDDYYKKLAELEVPEPKITPLTREQKIERVFEAMTKQIKNMVEEGRSTEDIIRFNQSQLEVICLIK